MTTRRILGALVVLAVITGSPTRVVADNPPAGAQPTEATPARVSYIHGQVSFWRPGGEEWAEAKVNTPLAPGDVLYTGADGTVEVQFGPRAFVRAGNGTQLGLDNQEPDFVQFRVIAGHAALDLRELPAGSTVEVDTPNAAFTVERPGYYHVDLSDDAATFRTHRGGSATMTPVGGTATPIAANQQIVITGTESPRVEIGPAPQLTTWDKWNYQRTAYLLQPAATQHVPAAVYGAEALAQHGTWRTEEAYGPVWVPATVAPGWVPYSTGRWIWDPRFGWTWLDDAPWGWAPYHYGRWVFVGSYWAWAPGPVVVRPVYSPALVVFLGGPVTVTVGVRPLHWAPLGWGEPVIPWWGRPGFIGVATWGGWGGPRVVNNVVINRTTTVNVTNITVYKNVHVHNAVVAVPGDRFGHGHVKPTRVQDVRELSPVRGALEVKPVAASVMPAGGAAVKPPAAIGERKVVATRAPRDFSPALREHGLGAGREVAKPAAPQIVPAPKRERAPSTAATTATPGANPAERGRRGDDPPSVKPGEKGRRGDDPPSAKPAEKGRRGDDPPGGPRSATGPGSAPDAGLGRAPAVSPGRAPDAGPGRAPDAGPRRPADIGPGAARPPAPVHEDKVRGPGVPDDRKPRAAAPPEAKPDNRAPREAGPGPRAVVQPPPPPAHAPTAAPPAPRAQGAPDGARGRPDARAKGPGDPRGRGEQGPPQGREGDRSERGDSKPGR